MPIRPICERQNEASASTPSRPSAGSAGSSPGRSGLGDVLADPPVPSSEAAGWQLALVARRARERAQHRRPVAHHPGLRVPGPIAGEVRVVARAGWRPRSSRCARSCVIRTGLGPDAGASGSAARVPDSAATGARVWSSSTARTTTRKAVGQVEGADGELDPPANSSPLGDRGHRLQDHAAVHELEVRHRLSVADRPVRGSSAHRCRSCSARQPGLFDVTIDEPVAADRREGDLLDPDPGLDGPVPSTPLCSASPGRVRQPPS